MDIENGLTLVMAAQSEDDSTYVELYRVEGVLALQDLVDVELSGHPGEDLKHLPDDPKRPWAMAYTVTRSQALKIRRWLETGLFIAIGVNVVRNKNGVVRKTQPLLVWRKPDNYLTIGQQAWLRAYSETSFDFTERLVVAAMIGAWVQAAAKAEMKPARAERRQKVSRKERRLSDKRRRTDERTLMV